MSDWYANIQGAQRGPAPLSDLALWIKNGELTPTDWVFPPGATDWVAAESVPELAAFFQGEHHIKPKTEKIIRIKTGD
ncbi:MAG: DUF4339 domain-containing protein [Verrucomicrobiae bacterium]|nr:DUF4339 domain-containing protein [Verrucomicrobiae bacterium]